MDMTEYQEMLNLLEKQIKSSESWEGTVEGPEEEIVIVDEV